jgi:hypothetical protein
MERYTCYLPSNLDVDTLLAECPPTGFEKFSRDKLIYVAGLVNKITANNKDLETPNGFVPVHAHTLQNNIRNYNQYLDYLLKTGIYQSDSTWVPGEKSTGYKYSNKYNSTVKPVFIQDAGFVKNLKKTTLNDYMNQRKYHYLYQWFNPALQINSEKAIDCALDIYNRQKEENEDKALQNLKRNLVNIDRINNQDYILTVDDTVGRFHSNITLLKSELRQFLTYDNQPLVSMDIVNAQPFFSTILFDPEFWKPATQSNLPITFYTIKNRSPHTFSFDLSSIIKIVNHIKENECQDVAHFMQLVSTGQFYEYLQHIACEKLKSQVTRKMIKKEILMAFNSDNRYNMPVKAIIKSEFPNVFKLFEVIKEDDKSNLSHILLNIEALLVLNRISKGIYRYSHNLPVFSIHDCLCSTNTNTRILNEFVCSELTLAFSSCNCLKIDKPNN